MPPHDVAHPNMNLAPAPVTPTPSSTAVARIQTALGDDDTAHDRLVALQEDVACRMVEFGQAGPIKPKDMLAFANRVYY